MARSFPKPVRLKDLPLAEIRKEKAGEYVYYPALKKSLIAAEGKEERVRFATYNLLISKYGYPANRIDVQVPVKIRDDEQPRFADIVVYDDDDPDTQIDPLYVLTFLRSAAGYAEIQRCIRGQSGHVYRDRCRRSGFRNPIRRTQSGLKPPW